MCNGNGQQSMSFIMVHDNFVCHAFVVLFASASKPITVSVVICNVKYYKGFMYIIPFNIALVGYYTATAIIREEAKIFL